MTNGRPSTRPSEPTSPGAGAEEAVRFPLEFEPVYEVASRLAGVTPSRAWVEVSADELLATFGPWSVRTPLTNIDSVGLTGPYLWLKVIGPPRLSLRDRGLTFAGTSEGGVCIHFRSPVRGIDPAGLLRHPALTVTVEEPEALVELLRDRMPEEEHAELDDALEIIDQESHDELEGHTAAELREIARADDIPGASKLKKDELIERIEHKEEDLG